MDESYNMSGIQPISLLMFQWDSVISGSGVHYTVSLARALCESLISLWIEWQYVSEREIHPKSQINSIFTSNLIKICFERLYDSFRENIE